MNSSKYISILNASNNNGRRKAQTAVKAKAKNTTNKKKKQASQKRELLKKSLESRKEFENLTTTWQEKLFEPVDIPLLQESAKYMQPSHYFEVVEERNAYNLCGFPICTKSPQEIEGQYRISLRARKIYDVSELKCYCSDRCLLGSRVFAAQLSVEPVYMRNFQTWLLPEVLPLDVDIRQIMKQRKQEAQASSFASKQKDYIKTLLAELPPAPPGLVIQEKVTEKNDDDKNNSMASSTNQMTYIHDSIEGYRIEFSKEKNQQDKEEATKAATTPVKPTTLVLPKEKSVVTVTDAAKEVPKTDEDAYELAMSIANAIKSIKTTVEIKTQNQNIGISKGKENKTQNQNIQNIKTNKDDKSKYRNIETSKGDKTQNINQIVKTDKEVQKENQHQQKQQTAPPLDLNSPTNMNNNDDNNKSISKGPILDLRIVPISQITQDETEPFNLANKRKKQKKIVPKMSMFGKIWTTLDRMTTQETRLYLHKMKNPSLVNVDIKETTNKIVASSEVVMRNNIFSEKIIESFNFLRSHLSITTSIENELFDLIRTFTIDNSSVFLNDIENNVLCLVFIYA
ncbi:3380_t:CDS:2 [Ambispora gerdemannii]|uniref:RNA polymerase II subunit B1 CTD phosphatase RPAP2 homolog n=1 Tax=Ambispora gerdemannii TaxID=144530 RepID=A0A9N8ZJF2_9GLOM|nr:3380_t:CDS:2 [Ambispora gerdemannii]